MKKKINILIISVTLTIIIFAISTFVQKKLIGYEPVVECLTVKENISKHQRIEEEMFRYENVPIRLVASSNIITSYDQIYKMYACDNIYKGQIAFSENFDTAENLMIFECEEGMEKLSIKIKDADNVLSYQIGENSKINLFATLRLDIAQNFLNEKKRLIIGNDSDGYVVIKVLENVKVLGVFNDKGEKIENSGETIDTIMISALPEEVLQINLLKEIATFNISEV